MRVLSGSTPRGAGNRLATTTTPYVGSGQAGWFAFKVRAPAAPGTYRLDVRGVIDGTTWLEGQGIFVPASPDPGASLDRVCIPASIWCGPASI